MSEPNKRDETADTPVTAEVAETGAAPTGLWPRTRAFANRHPMLLAWLALSIGMVAILLYTSKDVGLQPSQTLAMVVATIGVAAACVWIITWD